MSGRVARLVRAEFIKLLSHPFIFLSLGALALVIFLVEVFTLVGHKESEWRAVQALHLFVKGFDWGLYLATFALIIFSAMMIAGEFDRGTIKNILTRPVTRTEVFIAKNVTVVMLGTFLFLFVLYVALFFSVLWGDLGPVWDDTVFLVQLSWDDIAGHARKAVLITFVPFLAAGFLGILVSNWTESSGYSVAIALMLFVVADIVTGVALRESGQQYTFLYYRSYAMDKLTRMVVAGERTRWDPDIDEGLRYVTVPLYYIAGFLPPAYAIFRVRNIHA